MPKPIDTQEFWKKRIDTASRLFHSVYATTQEDWDEITRIHSQIAFKNITGKVLDAGCGFGRSSDWFRRDVSYIGVDFSPDFIEKAKSLFPDRKFEVANLKELPFEDKSFNWAFCTSIKAMVTDNLGEEEWEKMLKELKRVAKQILILEYTNPGNYEII